MVSVPLGAGLVVLLLLFPAGGGAIMPLPPVPPVCWSVFGYGVPCKPWLALSAAAATAGGVGLALWLYRRRRG